MLLCFIHELPIRAAPRLKNREFLSTIFHSFFTFCYVAWLRCSFFFMYISKITLTFSFFKIFLFFFFFSEIKVVDFAPGFSVGGKQTAVITNNLQKYPLKARPCWLRITRTSFAFIEMHSWTSQQRMSRDQQVYVTDRFWLLPYKWQILIIVV